MGVLSWLSKSSPPDYETLLSRLATDINEAKTHLSEIRLRERRVSFLLNLYGLGLWALWAGLWWVNGLPLGLLGISHESMGGKAVGGAGIAGGPIFIYLLNRLVHMYFTRQRTKEETHLRLLLTQQRKHIDAFKKATNYDSTRKLIEQYDDPSVSDTAVRSSPAVPSPAGSQRGGRTPVSPSPAPRGRAQAGPGGTPRAPGHLIGAGGTPGPLGPGTPITHPGALSPDQQALMQMQMHSIQPVLPTPEKRWYDRVVDSILGDDPSQAAQSKYALVCGECFRHNGLVGGKYEWERMQWICPRCNHLNPPPLSRLHPSAETEIVSQGKPQSSDPATPSRSSHIQRSSAGGNGASPRRRAGGDKGTPRSSRLGKEVFSASADAEGSEDGEDGDSEGMEVDDER